MSTASTVAPSAARRRAVAAPMPDAPPVTRALFPLSRGPGRGVVMGAISVMPPRLEHVSVSDPARVPGPPFCERFRAACEGNPLTERILRAGGRAIRRAAARGGAGGRLPCRGGRALAGASAAGLCRVSQLAPARRHPTRCLRRAPPCTSASPSPEGHPMPLSPDDFKVADLSLPSFGRKEIQLAEHEMPGLMATRAEFADAQPLAGAKIMGSLHMTIQTAVLIETLIALGADVRWVSAATSSPPRTTPPPPSSSAPTAPPTPRRACPSTPGRARRWRSTGGAPTRPCAGPTAPAPT